MKSFLGATIYGQSPHDTYEIIGELGRGNFGVVYEAISQTKGTKFAVKTFQTLDPDGKRSLINEGRQAVGIRHQNVVQIFYFHDGNQHPDLPPYMLMEYISGGTLEDLLITRGRDNFFTAEELTDMYLQLAEGMQAIFQRGLIHRDIKPDNILIENGVLKITDFGLSKIVDAATRSGSKTFKGQGAVAYYAPEAWRHEKNTVTMDIYSMGIVFYQTATLRYPYSVSRNPDWPQVHLLERAEDPLKFNPSIEPFYLQMIMKMLAKSPAARYQSWDEIISALQENRRRTTQTPRHEFTQLFQRDIETHRQREAEKLAAERQNQQQEETRRLIEYAVTDIREQVQSFVEAFNSGSQLTKLELVSVDSLTFNLQTRDTRSERKISFTIKPADILPQMKQLMQFNSVQVKAYGIVQSPSGYGFNLVLASHRDDDLHGQWHIIFNTQTFPYLGSQMSQTTPYSLEELPSRSLQSGFGRQSFSESLLTPLVHDLLAE